MSLQENYTLSLRVSNLSDQRFLGSVLKDVATLESQINETFFSTALFQSFPTAPSFSILKAHTTHISHPSKSFELARCSQHEEHFRESRDGGRCSMASNVFMRRTWPKRPDLLLLALLFLRPRDISVIGISELLPRFRTISTHLDAGRAIFRFQRPTNEEEMQR